MTRVYKAIDLEIFRGFQADEYSINNITNHLLHGCCFQTMQHEIAGIVNMVFLFLGILGGPGSRESLRNREITRKRIVLPEVNSLCLLNALGRRDVP